jgi:hypothetical protein
MTRIQSNSVLNLIAGAGRQPVVKRDPLLPALVLPPDYRGRQAWRRRMAEFRAAGRQILSFRKF